MWIVYFNNVRCYKYLWDDMFFDNFRNDGHVERTLIYRQNIRPAFVFKVFFFHLNWQICTGVSSHRIKFGMEKCSNQILDNYYNESNGFNWFLEASDTAGLHFYISLKRNCWTFDWNHCNFGFAWKTPNTQIHQFVGKISQSSEYTTMIVLMNI